jgi:hypothetical protein
MVGFVLIVVLVMVGLMIFLVISLRQDKAVENDVEVKNLLDSMMRYTTECAIVFEPQYDTLENLFKSCYEDDRCSNLNKPSCEYLNETLKEVVGALLASEATISAYQIDFLSRDSEGEEGIIKVLEGNCTGTVASAQRDIVSGGTHLLIRLKLCRAV